MDDTVSDNEYHHEFPNIFVMIVDFDELRNKLYQCRSHFLQCLFGWAGVGGVSLPTYQKKTYRQLHSFTFL